MSPGFLQFFFRASLWSFKQFHCGFNDAVQLLTSETWLIKTFLKFKKTSEKHNSIPANISTSDQGCFNAVAQRWDNVDPTLKMKQYPTLDFQRCKHWYNVVVRRWNNVVTTLIQLCSNLSSTLIKAVSKPVGLVIGTDL